MEHLFRTHFTREQARELLPSIRAWLESIKELRTEIAKCDERIETTVALESDLGGRMINDRVRKLADLKALLWEFYRRDIQIKDLDRGLIDFPSLMAGKEVFLCWEDGEDDVEFWHDLDAGYAGRERLD